MATGADPPYEGTCLRMRALSKSYIKELRVSLRLSQVQFAGRFGFSIAAVRSWERGRRRPQNATCVLLRVIAYAPDAVTSAIEAP